MENLEKDVKKAEILSDEELKNVCGGEKLPEVMEVALRTKCKETRNEADCKKLDFCEWLAGTWGDGACNYKG